MDGVGHRRGRLGWARVPRLLAASLLAVLGAPPRAQRRPARGDRRDGAHRGPAGPRPGVQRLHYEFGPIHIAPGQNTIEFEGNDLKPDVPGQIVRFKPDLELRATATSRASTSSTSTTASGSPTSRRCSRPARRRRPSQAPEGYGWPQAV